MIGAAVFGFGGGWEEGRKRSTQRVSLPSFHPLLLDDQISASSGVNLCKHYLFGLNIDLSEASVWTIPHVNYFF